MKLFQQQEDLLNDSCIVFVGENVVEFKTEKELFIEKTKKLTIDKMREVKPLLTITGKEFEGINIDEKREKAQKNILRIILRIKNFIMKNGENI